MFQALDGLPDQVLGLEAVGTIGDRDFEDVLAPAVEDRLSRNDKIRLLFVFGPDFEGYQGDASWDDALDVARSSDFDRLAVVTDVGWVRPMVRSVGWLVPADIEIFTVEEQAAALAWITA